MIRLWICLSLVLIIVRGEDQQIQRLDDFTFILVHNLSEVPNWNSYLTQSPNYLTQLSSPTYMQPQTPTTMPPPVPVAEPEPEPEPTTHHPPPHHAHSIPSPTCGVRGPSQGVRIVGGTNAQPAEFPWQVSLQLSVGRRARHICGGAVLSPHWVVTAGHCIWELDPSMLSIVAGDHDLYSVEGHEQRSQVARIVVNKYHRDTFTNDIALLQLATPLKVDNKWVMPICLPDSTQKFIKGESIVAGWGRLSENGALPHVLQHVTLPILNTKRCHSLYKRAGYSKFIHSCQLCSGYEQGALDSCQGDSGGPLVCRLADGKYYLCGIVSWGVGCARPNFPGVYTEVTCFVNWIRQILTNRGHVLNHAPAVVSISPGRDDHEHNQLIQVPS